MSDSNDSSQRELTLDEIQRDIDLFQERADPAVLAGYEARVLASQRNRRRTESKRAMLDEIQRLRRQRATKDLKVGGEAQGAAGARSAGLYVDRQGDDGPNPSRPIG